MKRFSLAVAVVALLGLILLPVLASVHNSFANSAPSVVDGGPLPLPPGPPIDSGALLVADGGPLPLPPAPPFLKSVA